MRQKPTSIRLTGAERELIFGAALARGMGVADFLRMAALERIESPQAHDQAAIAFKLFAEKTGELISEVIAQLVEERQAELEGLREEHRRERQLRREDFNQLFNGIADLLTELQSEQPAGSQPSNTSRARRSPLNAIAKASAAATSLNETGNNS